MTLKQLEYFLSCATLLNFRKAAQLHYLSPPTLTRHISNLEEELGVQLFQRDSHKVKLTEVGVTFFSSAYQMLLVYHKFYENTNLSGLHLQRRGNPFLIGSYAFDGMYGSLVDLILEQPDYFMNRPIHIDFIDAGGMIDAVQNGDIQIGIDSEEHVRQSGYPFEMQLLERVPFHVAVAPEHPLAGIGHISLEVLLQYLSGSTIPPRIFQRIPDFPVESSTAVQQLGELTIDSIPQLLQFLDTEPLPLDSMLILPRHLTAGKTVLLPRIEIEGDPCFTNYVLFWRKDNTNPDIPRFIYSICS